MGDCSGWKMIKAKVSELEEGLNFVSTELAEMKVDIEKMTDKEKIQILEREIEEKEHYGIL